MRLNTCLCAATLLVYMTCSTAQTGEEQTEPYHKHHDVRYGRDHMYPDRGAIVRDLPHAAVNVNYAGVAYRFDNGVWYEPRGPAFVVVDPPIGLLVPALPGFSTPVVHAGETYLYLNNVYYRARPELGGYEVVNEPADGKAEAAADVAAVATAPAAAVAPTPAAPPAGSAAAMPVVATAATPASAAYTASVIPASTAVFTTAAPAAPAALPGSVSTASPTPPAPTTPPAGPKVFIYPKTGQTTDQQARDRYECYRFAVAQTSYDPMRFGTTQPPRTEQQSDYERAQAACLEGRGYSVR